MGLKESLLERERQFWKADEEFYQKHLAEDTVMVFPEPTGILERPEILESMGGTDRWSTIEFSNERLLEISDEAVQLVYRAVAERSGDASEYVALITSTYIKENESWRLISHQQTPTVM